MLTNAEAFVLEEEKMSFYTGVKRQLGLILHPIWCVSVMTLQTAFDFNFFPLKFQFKSS